MKNKGKIFGGILAVVVTFFFAFYLIDRNRQSKASGFSDNISLEENKTTTSNFPTKNTGKLNGEQQHVWQEETQNSDEDFFENDQVVGPQDADDWWDYDPSTQILTIHPHELNAETDTIVKNYTRGWPWYFRPYSDGMTKVVIEPGVTAKGSLKDLFKFVYVGHGRSKLETIEGLNNLDTSQVTDMSYMFYNCEKLKNIDLSQLNTSQVTNMSYMFYGCESLENLNLENWNTNQVTNMSYMFSECRALTNLDLSRWDTSKVQNMTYMLNGCIALKTIDLTGNFSAGEVTDMSYMFYNCKALKTIDLSNFNTHKLQNIESMFYYCQFDRPDLSPMVVDNVTNMKATFKNSYIVNPNFSGWNTSNVTTMASMFDGCNRLTSLDVTMFNTSKVIDMSKMFYNCSKLPEIDVSNFETSNVIDMNEMFTSCKKIKTLDLNTWNTSKVVNMRSMFRNLESLESINLNGNFDPSEVTDMSYMFSHCKKLKNFDLSNLNTLKLKNMNEMFSYSGLENLDCSPMIVDNVTSMREVFYGCADLKTVNFIGWNTGNVTSMQGMFRGCSSLNPLDVTMFNTSNVNTMYAMFWGCGALTSIDVRNFDTSNVTNMSYMFSDCRKMPQLDLSAFNTSKVGEMQGMFLRMLDLVNLDITSFDTSSVSKMGSMFKGCKKMTSFDLSHFRTGKLTTMDYMFDDCQALTDVNVTSFDTHLLSSLDGVFRNCYELPTVDLSTWNTTNIKSLYATFEQCKNLANIDLSTWSTPNLTSLRETFDGCFKLTEIKMSNNFNTSKVTKMDFTFYECKSLEDFDFLRYFNTENVTEMTKMFCKCESVKSIPQLRNFKTSKNQSFRSMFSDCLKLSEIDISNFEMNSSNSVGGMFSNTPSLWKMTFGPRNWLSDGRQSTSSGLVNPAIGTLIEDVNDSKKYYCTSRQWREVDTVNGGTPHNSVGPLKDVSEVYDDLLSRTDVRTYVWDQLGEYSFEAPGQVNFHYPTPPFVDRERSSQDLKFVVKDSRGDRDNHKWQISAYANKIVHQSKPGVELTGCIFHYNDDSGVKIRIDQTPRVIHEHVVDVRESEDNWEVPWRLVVESDPLKIPEPGRYKSTVVYTFADVTGL